MFATKFHQLGLIVTKENSFAEINITIKLRDLVKFFFYEKINADKKGRRSQNELPH